jgi:hypothetical protein
MPVDVTNAGSGVHGACTAADHCITIPATIITIPKKGYLNVIATPLLNAIRPASRSAKQTNIAPAISINPFISNPHTRS